jgi:hypothetical protein
MTRYGLLTTLSVLFGVIYTAFIIYVLRTRKARRLKRLTLRTHNKLEELKYERRRFENTLEPDFLDNLRIGLDDMRYDLEYELRFGGLDAGGYNTLIKMIDDWRSPTLEALTGIIREKYTQHSIIF